MVRKMPETIWITSTSSASRPKKYQKLKFFGAYSERHGSSTAPRPTACARRTSPTAPEDGMPSPMPSPLGSWSSPMSSVLSLRKVYGGTLRLVGAGAPRNTRPAKSNLEPWQGQ